MNPVKPKKTRVCVVGLGYIGLPTAAIMATRGFDVHGVDIRQDMVAGLRNGRVPIEEPGLATVVSAAMKSELLKVDSVPVEADVFIIAVPTPFKKDAAAAEKSYREADLSYVVKAAESIAPHLCAENLVILESTSPPGTTASVVAPILESTGLKAGADFFLAYSPERVLPGAILKEMITNDRVVGGINPESARRARDVYKQFVEGEVFQTDCTTAEMVKLAENTYRDVNIALANELGRICERVGADVWEVVRLSNRHPRVHLHNAGPGVGGHCIAVDPWFLVQVCPDESPLIRTAREVNDAQPAHVVQRLEQILAQHGKGAVAFFGVTYKANVDDVRESPSLPIIRHFVDAGKECVIHDPHVSHYPYPLAGSLEEALAAARYLVFLVRHQEFIEIPPDSLRDKIIFDTQNLVDRDRLPESALLYTLGLSPEKRKRGRA
jgi:UDP-N-acetyl-D-mannosaminuronic acid dehydrogenase